MTLLPNVADPVANVKGYTDIDDILRVCRERAITLVHPGYGFLSENAGFSRRLEEVGVKLLGPSAQAIEDMSLKHRARELAVRADLPVVPGSHPSRLVESMEEGTEVAEKVGYPVMLKATASGGGMGLVVCGHEAQLQKKFVSTQQRAKAIFHNAGVFIEKYFASSRHIEVQIFGDGHGHVVYMGERECSIQRGYQKIFEETPGPYLQRYLELSEKLCDAAVRFGKLINYGLAGTVEFLVDDKTGNFYFLEMKTRIQVEHTIVTESLHPDLDVVELMIRQGIAELDDVQIPPRGGGAGLRFSVLFHVDCVVAVTGALASVTIDGRGSGMWAPLVIAAGVKLAIAGPRESEDSPGGLRAYVSILGGLPGIPQYLGSKSTSMGMGRHQGRALQTGDALDIRAATHVDLERASPSVSANRLPRKVIPLYPTHCTLHALPGPRDDTTFLTTRGIEKFYATRWRVSSASNRMGIRLEYVADEDKGVGEPALLCSRETGGEGSSHPSNRLDNGYARGSVNLNGDTPVILTCEGPSMGGYVCVSTVATADQ